MKRVLVAMSGGVDSSVAAALLVERGFDVTGVTLKLWEGKGGEAPTTGCCTAADAADARRVAGQLGIDYYVLDYTEEFRADVVDYYVEGSLSGVTPNPCVECNRSLKFSLLLERARTFGCDFLATGHHARVVARDGRHALLRGRDAAKDQSYVLYMLRRVDLERLVLPVGEMTKDQVRKAAADYGLGVADKPESQDVCFTSDLRAFLVTEAGARIRPGRAVLPDGSTAGSHPGVALLTVGQRRGAGVSTGERMYVREIDAETGVVKLGRRDDLYARKLLARDASWVSGTPPGPDERVEAKTRYSTGALPARVFPGENGAFEIEFEKPAWAPAPGQAVVVYSGDEVLGGGTIVGWS